MESKEHRGIIKRITSYISHKYPVRKELRERRWDRKVLYSDAIEQFAKEKPVHGSLSDYKKALYKHRVSYREYMYGYEYWRLDEKQRNAFISQREMWCIYRKIIQSNVGKVLANKVLFLKSFKSFVHREWINPIEVDFDSFLSFVNCHDCIAKPLLGDQGKGVFMVDKKDVEDYRELYEYCRTNNYLIEEKIKACPELEGFHPQSLNTIRVVTMSGKGKCEVLGALFRMGVNGSVVDNSHAGGLCTPIDIQTGITMTDGIGLNGESFEFHPDSGKRIKGFCIPHWDDCLRVCFQASQVIPNNYITGWDICVMPDRHVELIEGNYGPDVDGGLQAPLKKGIKKRVQEIGKRLYGFDPLSLLPFWSRSYKDF